MRLYILVLLIEIVLNLIHFSYIQMENLAKSEADDNAGAYYFTISYPAKSIN